jgi:hypothetical protein
MFVEPLVCSSAFMSRHMSNDKIIQGVKLHLDMYQDKQQVISRSIGKPGYYCTTHNESLKTLICVAPIATKISSTNRKDSYSA